MIGIDVSKDNLAVTWLDPQTRRIRWEATVPNSPVGIERILRRTPAGMPLVLEPTGRYSQAVATRAQAAQRPVLLAQPKRARAFLAAVQPRAKTDRVDSRGLALYGLCADLRPYPLKSKETAHLDDLLAVRKSLSQTLARLRQQRREFPDMAGVLEAPIKAIEETLARIDRELEHPPTPTATHRQAQELDRIPGVGLITSLTVASRLQAKTFPTPDAFVAYAGLDVKVRQSGRFQGHCKLTKQGDPELRRLLFVAATATLRCKDNPFREQFAREAAKGMSTTAAACAVARKIAKICWSMVTHGTTYNPARIYTRPTKRPPKSTRNSVVHDP
jgi:transposase